MSKTSLLITIFNRAHLLKNSLERLTYLTLPDEVLIVDDGSSDNCKEVVSSFESKLPVRYIYNHNPQHSICSMARNIGVKNTDCEIIITSEPEILFVTDVIAQVKRDMKENKNQIVSAGTIYHAQPNCQVGEGFCVDPVQALKDSIVQDYEIQPRSYHPSGFCKTKNLQATYIAGYRRDWLLEVGGWDEEFKGVWGWDDIELCTRLRINGINQFIDLNIEAVHQYHGSLPPHIQGQASQINEEHMKSKKLNEVEQEILEHKKNNTYKKIDERLIANRGKEWGVIIPR